MIVAALTVQAQSKPNLHTLLDELSEIHKTIISFSPTLVDNIFPKRTDTSGELESALKRILEDTGYGYKVIGECYYIYQLPTPSTPKKPVKKVPPTPKTEPKPDTNRLHIAVIDVESMRPVYDAPQIKLTELEISPLAVYQVQNPAPVVEPQPLLAVKTNLLYDATVTINMGVEIGLGRRTTLDLSGNYNNWTFTDNHKMKHWLVQPEFRYWTCSRFSGGFWGIHAHWGGYNWGGMLPWGFNSGKMFGSIENPTIMHHRYQGWLAGAGIGYGYHWIMGNRWGLEAEIGAGYAYLEYDAYRCEKCSEKIGRENKNYFGPTKIAISLIYMLK